MSQELIQIVSVMIKTPCSSDSFPSKLLMSYLPTIMDVIIHILNLCLTTSVFHFSYKFVIVLHLIRKAGLASQVLKIQVCFKLIIFVHTY